VTGAPQPSQKRLPAASAFPQLVQKMLPAAGAAGF
jgi:hypothetical protein